MVSIDIKSFGKLGWFLVASVYVDSVMRVVAFMMVKMIVFWVVTP